MVKSSRQDVVEGLAVCAGQGCQACEAEEPLVCVFLGLCCHRRCGGELSFGHGESGGFDDRPPIGVLIPAFTPCGGVTAFLELPLGQMVQEGRKVGEFDDDEDAVRCQCPADSRKQDVGMTDVVQGRRCPHHVNRVIRTGLGCDRLNALQREAVIEISGNNGEPLLAEHLQHLPVMIDTRQCSIWVALPQQAAAGAGTSTEIDNIARRRRSREIQGRSEMITEHHGIKVQTPVMIVLTDETMSGLVTMRIVHMSRHVFSVGASRPQHRHLTVSAPLIAHQLVRHGMSRSLSCR
jgi:hypothetical protein